MKHAYLILAHAEFEVLRLLVALLDNEKNDIYIHFDKKVKEPPRINTVYSNVYPIEKRIDVRWADVSMIEAEYALFEAAYHNGNYDYFHLLSGVDLPLKPISEIDYFFTLHAGKEFIGFHQEDITEELNRRLQRFHLFPKTFRERTGIVIFLKRLIRFSFLNLQKYIGYKRHKNKVFQKGTQWVSLTNNFVAYLLSIKEEQLSLYQNTFCADESFVQTVCWNTPFREHIYNAHHEGLGCMRAINWVNGEIKNYTSQEVEKLLDTPYLWGRKFTSQNIEDWKQIKERISTICHERIDTTK